MSLRKRTVTTAYLDKILNETVRLEYELNVATKENNRLQKKLTDREDKETSHE